MVDGVYDVAASLDPSPIVTPSLEATVTISLSGNAIVADEQVIDMVMSFLETTYASSLGFPLTKDIELVHGVIRHLVKCHLRDPVELRFL